MTRHDFDSPFITQDAMGIYAAKDKETGRRYGQLARATKLSNVEYRTRFGRFGASNNMRAPPSCGRIFIGYLVVRHFRSPGQYETWMAEDAFAQQYYWKADASPLESE